MSILKGAPTQSDITSTPTIFSMTSASEPKVLNLPLFLSLSLAQSPSPWLWKKVLLWRCQLSQGHPEQRRFSPLCISSSHPSVPHFSLSFPLHLSPLFILTPISHTHTHTHTHTSRLFLLFNSLLSSVAVLLWPPSWPAHVHGQVCATTYLTNKSLAGFSDFNFWCERVCD